MPAVHASLNYDALIPFPMAQASHCENTQNLSSRGTQGEQHPPFVGIGLRVTVRGLATIDYVACSDFIAPTSTMARTVVSQLEAYFADGQQRFDLPLDIKGTPFQQRVWAALQRIPVGETRTYGDLAKQLGSAAQAVGQACKRNPVSVVVPCHRVVAAQGMGGYGGYVAGARFQIKQALLDHEGWVGLTHV